MSHAADVALDFTCLLSRYGLLHDALFAISVGRGRRGVHQVSLRVGLTGCQTTRLIRRALLLVCVRITDPVELRILVWLTRREPSLLLGLRL